MEAAMGNCKEFRSLRLRVAFGCVQKEPKDAFFKRRLFIRNLYAQESDPSGLTPRAKVGGKRRASGVPEKPFAPLGQLLRLDRFGC